MALQYCVTKKGSERKVAVKCNIYCNRKRYTAQFDRSLLIPSVKMESAFAMSNQWQLIHPR